MNQLSKITFSIFFILFTVSCTNDKEEITPVDSGVIVEPTIAQELCDSIGSSFSVDILPLLSNNCTPCHVDGGNSGGHSWTNYDEVFADKNLILSAINHEASTANMPLGKDKLSDDIIQIFDCWVINGALDN